MSRDYELTKIKFKFFFNEDDCISSGWWAYDLKSRGLNKIDGDHEVAN